ncbi:hypothetical protein J2T12_001433 [Paenibacillus anaericanus]|nr:hypothetical protein [Paenibacillus anaericanus]
MKKHKGITHSILVLQRIAEGDVFLFAVRMDRL